MNDKEGTARAVPLLCKDGNFFQRGKSWEVEHRYRVEATARESGRFSGVGLYPTWPPLTKGRDSRARLTSLSVALSTHE